MVSMQGEDEPGCLTASSTTPCKTLSYALTGVNNVVCINGTFQNISENIRIKNTEYGNYEGDIIIICMSCLLENSNVTFNSSFGKNHHVLLANFTIRHSSITLQNIFVKFKNVVLEQVSIQDHEKALTLIYFEDCYLACFETQGCGLSLLRSSTIKAVFKSSLLNNFKLDLDTQGLMLKMIDTFVQQSNIHVRVQSPPYLRIPSFIQVHNITVNSYGGNHTRKRYTEPLASNSEIILDLTNPYLHINKCNFYKTHLEVIANRREFNQAYFWGVITDTKFMSVYYQGDGGALSIVSDVPHSQLVISSCVLTNNTAVKSSSALKGHVGGVYIKSGSLDLDIKNTVFLGNKAADVGLHLYTSIGVTVALGNCSFSYSVDPLHPIQGVLMFIAGTATQQQSSFRVTNLQPQSYVGPISLFYVAMGNDVDMDITCPEWYWHNVEYNSPTSESNSISDIRYGCYPCSDNYYAISASESGLSYNPSNGSILDIGNDVMSDICIKCSYGSICTGNNVIPRPNYWGYWHEGELEFQQCPAGYCCSGSDNSTCNVYDYCEGNRTDTLCGACQEGFSVSILTGACTLDSQCGGDQWFWLVAFLAAMAYALWYTLKDDIFAVFFASIRFLKGLFNCFSCTRNDVTVSNKESPSETSFHDIENIEASNEEANDEANYAANDEKISQDSTNTDDIPIV